MRAQWFSTRDRLVFDLSSLTLVVDSNDVFFSYISGYLVVFITQQIHDYIDYIPGKCFSKTYQVCNRCATVTFTKTCLQVFTLRLLVDAPALYALSTLAHTSFLQRFTVSICSNSCYSPGWFRRNCLVDDTADRPLAAQTALDLGGEGRGKSDTTRQFLLWTVWKYFLKARAAGCKLSQSQTTTPATSTSLPWKYFRSM